MDNGHAPIYDRVTEYACKVVSGEIVAGELHKLACQRHLNDLKRQRSPEFPYYYAPDKALEIIEYAETLTIAYLGSPRTEFTMSVGDEPIPLTASGGSGTYTWSSSDDGIASVDASGKVTAVSAGQATLTVTDGSGLKPGSASWMRLRSSRRIRAWRSVPPEKGRFPF